MLIEQDGLVKRVKHQKIILLYRVSYYFYYILEYSKLFLCYSTPEKPTFFWTKSLYSFIHPETINE